MTRGLGLPSSEENEVGRKLEFDFQREKRRAAGVVDKQGYLSTTPVNHRA
jgi:hypothetical protein